jgi:hypothetical protein
LLALLLVPGRWAFIFPSIVLLALIANSVVASNEIGRLVNASEATVVGSPADWIDRAAAEPVAYLYDGESYWNGVWQERFWNRRIDDVLSVRPARVPGPMRQIVFSQRPDGRLPTADRYIVATGSHTFVGRSVAAMSPVGLTLWRLEPPARISTSESGVLPNGDMTGPANVNVYDCRHGHLVLTLLPKATKVLRIFLDGRLVLRQAIAGVAWHGAIPVPPSSSARLCTFTIVPQQLLGSTQIAFVRD